MKKSISELIANYYLYYYVFSLFFMPLAVAEISSHFIEIPSYESLNKDSGSVIYTKVVSRWGHQFILKTDTKKIMLLCNLNYGDSIYCPPFDLSQEMSFFENREVVVRWYTQKYMFGGSSNLLLELEMDGRKLLNYETQKDKYLNQASRGSLVCTLLVTFLLGLGVYGNLKKLKLKESIKFSN